MKQVLHLVTDHSGQLGGIAGVVKEILKLNGNRSGYQVSACWIHNDAGRWTWLVERIRHKINRTLARDPHGHPYRFPSINHLRIREPNFSEPTVVHIHKPSLWKQGALWKARHPKVALAIHAHSVDGFTGGCVLESNCPMLAGGCHRCPIVQPFARSLPPLGFKYRARLLRQAKPLIIANSHATRRAITASNLIPDACRVEVVQPGTDASFFFQDTTTRGQRSGSTNRLTIGFVAYSIENSNKGFDDFVETLRILRAGYDAAGRAAGEVRPETVRRFPDIQFTGPLMEGGQLREFYQSIDYLVVPSKSESFGLVSIEAQFCGTPVVCYDVGGLPETILEQVTGLVVREPTPQALASGVQQLHRQGVPLVYDPECRQIREFLESFETNRINAKYASIYEALFQGACPGF